MKITKEIDEILQYLSKRNDYVIFAGFAAYLYTNIEASNDIDIFVPSYSKVNEISKDMISKGWKKIKANIDNRKRYFVSTLEKNKTTFDICFSESAKKAFVSSKNSFNFKGTKISLISIEGLFLTKVSQMSFPRSEYKTERDRKVIAILREKISVIKLKKILDNLPNIFWKEGR